jgi:hypothetical protein
MERAESLNAAREIRQLGMTFGALLFLMISITASGCAWLKSQKGRGGPILVAGRK